MVDMLAGMDYCVHRVRNLHVLRVRGNMVVVVGMQVPVGVDGAW